VTDVAPAGWLGAPPAGTASIRFKGTGPSAHLDVEGDEIFVPAGARGAWTISYRPEVWPVLPGGGITIWKWAPKFTFGLALQHTDRAMPGYCSAHVEADRAPARRAPSTASARLTYLARRYQQFRHATVAIEGQALAPGERVCFVAGDVSGGAPPIAVQAYSMPSVPIDVHVDHDGDGYPEAVHRLWVHVVPDGATRLRAVAPSAVTTGEPFAVRVMAEDAHCNPGARFEGEVRVALDGITLAHGRFDVVAGRTQALRLAGLRLPSPGVSRLEVRAVPDGGGPPLQARTNPVRVTEASRSTDAGVPSRPLRPYWGEMHSHTHWADGSGTVEENYRFAREDACLDWFSTSEHIILGPIGPDGDYPINRVDSPMPSSAAYWRECQAVARRHHRPGEFVTFIGYEWTPFFGYAADGSLHRSMRSTWGDHCVWFLRDDHPLVLADSLAGELAALAALDHEALARGERPSAMIVPHPGGGATDWTHYAGRDLVAMPAAEVTSMHAHAEWFLQRALAAGRRDGFRLGACGMHDGHAGHPGYDVWSRHGVATLRERPYSVQGGLTAALALELTREAIWDALFDRRTYATSGERMLLDFWVENATSAGPADPRHARAHAPAPGAPSRGAPGRLAMGQTGTARQAPRFRVRASGTAPLDLVEIVRDDRRVQRWALPPDTWDVELTWTDEQPLRAEAAYYVRVTQSGDAFAWSSPIWLTCASEAALAEESPDVQVLPRWNEGAWPPPGDDASLAEAAGYLPAALAHLGRNGAAGKYGGWAPVGMFGEQRGRCALFRGHDVPTGRPVQLRYYPDFSEDRVRIESGWADYGVGSGHLPDRRRRS
jgi:hypothetical protein